MRLFSTASSAMGPRKKQNLAQR